ncbi:hypothetical protein Ddye_027126 [Dipteronia dyeriana]|uniref:Uncharacterized protein n=1 Tax=Dipteronia dyeriana TaxID=168575 RepID=A0AAD9WQ66_9ROSI|nr:hypothetical protein Ddye_027126 [Dipteronia dyeriana]
MSIRIPVPAPLFPNQRYRGLLRNEAPVTGRYISKREQAAIPLSVSGAPSVPDPSLSKEPDPPVVVIPPVQGSISDTDLPRGILSLLRHQSKVHAQQSRISGRLSADICYHRKVVNAINWTASHAVKDVKLPQQGHFVLSCCYDRHRGGSKGALRLWDIRTGKVGHQYIQGLGPILDVKFTLNGKQFIWCQYE